MSGPGIPGGGQRRPVELVGAVNLGDIGGYPTVDGGCVRYGLIYRSDSFAELTDEDIELVGELGLRTICDLRHDSEREAKPNRALPRGSTKVHAIGFLPYRALEMVAAARQPGATPEAMRDDIREVYRRFVREETATYRTLFNLMLEENALPLLVHCTSGKDRTGMAIAILFMALGVPSEEIEREYLMSNQFRRDLAYLGGSGMPPEMLDVMMEVHPTYLKAALDEIETTWGTTERFLAEAMGLSPDRIERLRNLLVDRGPTQLETAM